MREVVHSFPTRLILGVQEAFKKSGLIIPHNSRFPTATRIPEGLRVENVDEEYCCSLDTVEVFPGGVPIWSMLHVQENGHSPAQFWYARLRDQDAYWTGCIQVHHGHHYPGNRWRLLHFLEAVSLLVIYPHLREVDYWSPNAHHKKATVFFNAQGEVRVTCTCERGAGMRHRAYTPGPCPYLIEEKPIR